MTPRLTLNIMLFLTVCYGAAVAILAVTDTPGLGNFTIIGAIVLGVLWVGRGFLIRGSR
ncbi:hypothetical protein [Dactylosporangium sp. CS-033363]|uniref:hypothetical protein n=1 Tax=Dactylosporangium sp. CS-033363 TaxID=3239935 RepID=UPI003D90E50E